MINKGLLVLIFALFIAGTALAQTEDSGADETDIKMPKNTISLDLEPLIDGLITRAYAGAAGNMNNTARGAEASMPVSSSSFSFGIAAQYERQILDRLNVCGRFSWLGNNMDYRAELGDHNTALTFNYYSFSIEAHIRYYPSANIFFLDGMLGYAYLSAALSSNLVNIETREEDSAAFSLSRSYVKLGGKLGWRIDFGKPGGFVLEPSIGFFWGIGVGDSLLKQFAQKVSDNLDEPVEVDEGLDVLSSVLEQFLVDGGFRFALTFGWRF